VELHDGHPTIGVTQLDVTSALAGLNKSQLAEHPDYFRP